MIRVTSPQTNVIFFFKEAVSRREKIDRVRARVGISSGRLQAGMDTQSRVRPPDTRALDRPAGKIDSCMNRSRNALRVRPSL